MKNLLQIVDSLNEKLQKLLQKQSNLRSQNEHLTQQNLKLKQQIEDKQLQLENLQNEFESLRIAKAIVGSKEDKHITKLKINALVREIDKCIVQLSD